MRSSVGFVKAVPILGVKYGSFVCFDSLIILVIKGFTYDVTELSSTDDNQTDPNLPDSAQSKSVSISNDGNDESTTIEGDAKSTTSQNDAKLNTTEEDAKLTRSQDDAKLATIHSQDDIKSTTIQSIEDRKSTTSENDEKITTSSSSQEDATAAIKDDKIDSVPNETKPKQENRILEDIEVDLQEYNKKKAEEKERCVHSLIRLSVSQCVR